MLGFLCIIGCPVQLRREVFSEIAFVVVDTHLPRFEALAFVSPHFDALTRGLLKVYYRSVFNESSEASIFQKCAESLHPDSKKFYFGLSLVHIFQKMCATPGACIKAGCLARRSLYHKVNLPASCEAQRLLCHKVNLLSCVARRP